MSETSCYQKPFLCPTLIGWEWPPRWPGFVDCFPLLLHPTPHLTPPPPLSSDDGLRRECRSLSGKERGKPFNNSPLWCECSCCSKIFVRFVCQHPVIPSTHSPHPPLTLIGFPSCTFAFRISVFISVMDSFVLVNKLSHQWWREAPCRCSKLWSAALLSCTCRNCRDCIYLSLHFCIHLPSFTTASQVLLHPESPSFVFIPFYLSFFN